MGRPPIGKKAMTGAERIQRWRLKHGIDKRQHTDKVSLQTSVTKQLHRVEAEADALRAQLAERDREIAHLREQLKAKVAATPDHTEKELRDAIKGHKAEEARLWRLNIACEESNRLLRKRKGLLTQSQFNHLKACLRPDFRDKNITPEKLTQTRMAIEALEKVLVKPKG